MKNTTYSRGFRVLATLTAIGGTLAVGGLAAGSATGSSDDASAVFNGQASFARAVHTTLSTAATLQLAGPAFADYGPQIADARTLPAAPGDNGTPLTAVPGRNGACLVGGDDVVTCAPADAVQRGELMKIDLTTPPGTPAEAAKSAGTLSIRGFVPDGRTQATVVDSQGQAELTVPVRNNVYFVKVSMTNEPAGIRLDSDTGKTSLLVRLGH